MPRRAKPLSAKGVQTAGPGRYGDGAGLYLLVRDNEKNERLRFWLFRYTMGGKLREAGLGPASGQGAVSLADARIAAGKLRALVRDGRDPLAEKAERKAAAKAAAQEAAIRGKTFRQVANLYLAAHESTWKNAKHRQQWANTLRDYALPKFGDVPVAQIGTEHVMHAIEPIWHDKPETASRLRGRIETVLDYAKARQWRRGENPARWRGHIENMLPHRSKVAKVEHHAALPWQEVGAFMEALDAEEGLAAIALRLTILTATRTSEVLNATWPEVDLEAATWVISAARMKAGSEHRVPLAPSVVALLRELLPLRDAERGDWVFPGGRKGRPLSNMAMLMLLRRMGRGELTTHGFRSCFRDWCAEQTNYPREVAEAALAHTIADKVEAAYRRGDLFEKRRRLMEDWATYCGRPAAAGEVVPIRAAEVAA